MLSIDSACTAFVPGTGGGRITTRRFLSRPSPWCATVPRIRACPAHGAGSWTV